MSKKPIKHQPASEVLAMLSAFGLKKSKSAVFKFVLADSNVECELETIRKDKDRNIVFLIRPIYGEAAPTPALAITRACVAAAAAEKKE